MKKYLQKCFMIACLMSFSFLAVAATETKIIFKEGVRFYRISDNGKFVVGNIGTDVGLVYSVEHDQIIYLTGLEEGAPQSQANGVTNDGVVYGQYMNNAAVYNIYWEEGYAFPQPLSLPEGMDYESTEVRDVTADGRYAVGGCYRFDENLGGTGTPFKWDLTTGTVEICGLSDDKNVIWGVMAFTASSNGERGTGRVIYDTPTMQKFLVGLWDKDGNMTKLFPETYSKTNYDEVEVLGTNSDMSKIVGAYFRFEEDPNTGFGELLRFPYVYDVEKNEAKIFEEYEGVDFFAYSDNGLITAANSTGGIPMAGNGMIYDEGKLYDMSDWLIEFYGRDDFSDFVMTGLPLDITPDGKTIVGTTGLKSLEDGSNPVVAYIIMLGDKKECPKITDLKADVLGNSVVSLSWNAPTGNESPLLGYNVYNNGEMVNEALLTQTNFSETLKDYGKYHYSVEAKYQDGCSSGKSDEVGIEIYRKGSCYTPNKLAGWTQTSEYIKLEWETPDFDLTYDTGIDPQGSVSAGDTDPETGTLKLYPFYFGFKWTEKEIEERNLDGASIMDVSFNINAIADYDIVIFTNPNEHKITQGTTVDKGSVEIYRQSIPAADIEAAYDTYATFALTTPVVIDKANKNYYISIYAKNYADGTHPATYDFGPMTAQWKSELIAYEFDPRDEIVWYSLKTLFFDADVNWILSSRISHLGEDKVTTPVENVPSIYDADVESYTIFRNGVEIAETKTNTYVDSEISKTDDAEYIYKVKANYRYDCSSEFSNEVTLSAKSVNELLENSIKLYPNPVENGLLYIDANYNSLTISDIQGRVIMQVPNAKDIIDVSELKTGAYFVKIITDNGSITKKVMIK